jgi:signal transduction histidine kinase
VSNDRYSNYSLLSAVGELARYLEYINLALYTLVAVVALRQLRAGRGRAALWAALTFVSLALVADLGRALPENPTNDLEEVAFRCLIAVLVLFPYFLYRFTTAFRPPTRLLERALGLMTVVLLVWTFVLPEFPAEDEPRSTGFEAFLIAFVVHWTVLSVVVAVQLWRARRGQPGVARRRMVLFSVGAAAITVAIVIAAFNPDEEPAAILAASLLASLSAVSFLFGLAPPAILRLAWRRHETERLQDAINDLMAATSEREVVDSVLPPMAGVVGARAVALRSDDGRVLGTHGAAEEMFAHEAEGRERLPDGSELVCLAVPSGSLLVWTSPYAPYFGPEELSLLSTLGALTGLALDRTRLFARERESREALERADEVKSNFVALAAHELRTPVATVHGIIETLHAHADRLSDANRAPLEETLLQQSGRMRSLVDQLLDLSRLDAEAVAINPERFAVRERVDEIVQASAGGQEDKVDVEVPEGLEAVADTAAFDRIVSNLVVNAFRYGSPPVRISAEQRDRHLRVRVEDRGAGVPPHFIPDLFERFTRERDSVERAGGTGLGLAIARSYANAHGGDLVYSDASPHGALFELVLPQGG